MIKNELNIKMTDYELYIFCFYTPLSKYLNPNCNQMQKIKNIASLKLTPL